MIDLTLPDMSCAHCVRAITAAVHAIDADAKLEFELPQHRVHIDTPTPPEVIRAALAAEGYPAAS